MATFEDVLQQSGYPLPTAIIRDGSIHRFGRGKSCWYVAHDQYAAAGDWREEFAPVKWRATEDYHLSSEARKKLKEAVESQRHVWQGEQQEGQLDAAKEAARLFREAAETGQSEYLKRKQIKGYGVRYGQDSVPYLMVPIRDVAGTLWSVQKIYEDGTKRFLTGGKKAGGFHVIGRITVSGVVYVAEGYATAATIHEATGRPVIVCFDAGNIRPVLSQLAAAYPTKDWIIAADNDAYGAVNVGVVKAREAAKEFGCKVIIPEFSDTIKKEHQPTDFNDLFVLQGAYETKRQLLLDSKTLVAHTLHEFLDMEIPPREMILAPILPTQGLVMLYGIRGGGKTYVALSVALAVASGTSTLGGYWNADEARRVAYVDGEMSASVMQERLAALSVNLPHDLPAPDYLRIITPDAQEAGIPDLGTVEGQEAIEQHLDGVALVILDNLSALMRHGKENEAESWVPIQSWLLSLRRRGISVLIVHHANKGGGQRGTSKKEDLLDTVIALKRPDDYDPQHGAQFSVQYEKARGFHGDAAQPFEARLVSEGQGLRWEVKSLEDSLAIRILELHGEQVTQRDIAKEVGCSAAKVNRVLKAAKEKGVHHGRHD